MHEPLDVVITKPFKNAIKEFGRHLDENLDDYVDGKLIVSARESSQPGGWLGNHGEWFVKVKIPSYARSENWYEYCCTKIPLH